MLHEAHRADLSHYLDNPWGTGVEVIEAGALFAAEREAARSARSASTSPRGSTGTRTVSPSLEEPAPPAYRMNEARVTVDTPEDYARVRRLFADLYRGVPLESDAVVAWCRSHA